jgi:raffinose/stachyose/melibiose transport system permease protein
MTALTLPFGLIVLKNYMDDIPSELVEAAMIDGCSSFGIYKKIIFPLSLPAIAAVTIFTFLGSWNEFLLPLILLRRDELLPLTKLPTYFMNEYSADISLWFASFVVITMPVLILYLFLQKYFISGLTEGVIK